jgi:predicted DNA-binding protein with PD1-like motif
VETNRGRTEGFSLIFETGEEIASVLQQFSKNQKLAGSSFKAIGALSYTKLGWLNSEPAFPANNWNCFRSLATLPS